MSNGASATSNTPNPTFVKSYRNELHCKILWLNVTLMQQVGFHALSAFGQLEAFFKQSGQMKGQ